jgi:flavin reductase (DIM6/NTAB) family NADH-FMN oxidoreductase RutF
MSKRQKAEKIKAPLVGEAFANLECKVAQIVDLGASALVIGQVVAALADDAHFRDGKLIFDNGLELLHHLGGDRFCVSDRLLEGKRL